MKNGEETHEASPDPIDELPWQSQRSDGGDESPAYSQYSSGGDSDFERYCSANSVMGTPSLCSTIGTFQECGDSEPGSARSFGLGDVGSLENFSLGSGFARKFGEMKLSSANGSGCFTDHGVESFEIRNSSDVINNVVEQGLVRIDDGLHSCSNMEGSLRYEFNDNHTGTNARVSRNVGSESELPSVMDLNSVLDDEFFIEDNGGGIVRWGDHIESALLLSSAGIVPGQQTANTEAIEENVSHSGVNSTTHSLATVEVEGHSQINNAPVNSCLHELYSHSDVEYDRREDGICSDEDKASSRVEHSDGEDSMFGYGTDDELKMDLLQQRTLYHQKTKVDKENSLLMRSSTAFGSDDWDDFVQETRESGITAIMLEKGQPNTETERNLLSYSHIDPEQGQDVMDISVASNQFHVGKLAEFSENASLTPVDLLINCDTGEGKDAEDIVSTNSQAGDICVLAYNLKTCSGCDISQREQDTKEGLNFMGGNLRTASPGLSDDEFEQSEESTSPMDPLSNVAACPIDSASTEKPEDPLFVFVKEPCSLVPMDENSSKRPVKDSPASVNLFENHPKEVKMDNLELNEFYCDFVHEMEEILLDSTESPEARFTRKNTTNQSHLPLSSRDGGSTASTSGSDDICPLIQRSLTIHGVEVVGAKQKKGDVSFGERLVGVKEYTVYTIRVWSGKDHWEVERRYRDFSTLYRRLKTLFDSQRWILPPPWSSVERESRKIFGNVSPDVVEERSALIQECLLSILHYSFPSSLPHALIWFLSPSRFLRSSPASCTFNSQSPSSTRGSGTDSGSTRGKTISLIVEILPYKSSKQILEAQHYTCAGCHKHFDDGKTRMLEFVQTIGWGKPRFCEYTGQLFCSSCHSNETAVLPARVLHHWDFTLYPVSQLAKSYLDSIHNQPMLCVSAVNPLLFSKVPALLQVMGVRKKIGVMLPFVRCPFRMSIYKGLASRRYLLESNDFFALRDLIDLSKGAFAGLPVMVDIVSRKILEHLTEQCLVCCDVGVPCNARQACDDPSSLIFPFQEEEIERCRSCKSAFHKPCIRKITSCPCGELLKDGSKGGSTNLIGRSDSELSGTLDFLGRKSDSSSTRGFLSGLFSKAKQEKLWGRKDSDNVILMGSLPSTSL